MKTIVMTLFFVLSFQLVKAQESPYQKQWIQIDTLELRGQVKSALQLVDGIRKVSDNTSNINDYVKASLYRWKFLKIVTEDAEHTIIKEIDETLEKLPVAQKAVLQVIKARLLYDYYNEDRYRINERISVSKKEEDITTWSGVDFVNEIINIYQEVLRNKEKLIKIPISEVEPLLLEGLLNRHYKPTLYDLIAQEALNFYKNPLYGIDRPAVLFEIKHPSFFNTSEAFRHLKFETEDTLASSYNAVRLMQEIEELHALDEDPTAYVYAQLRRLQFAKQYATNSAKDSLYEKGLSALSRKHKKHFIHGVLQVELASHYVNLARGLENKEENYYLKAKDICTLLLEKYPNSEASIRATHVLKEIHQAELFIKVQAETLPGKANRMFVSYRNVDTLCVKIIKAPTSYNVHNAYTIDSEFWDIISGEKNQNAIVDSLTYILPKSKDLNQHSTEVLLPKLPHGKYLFYVDNEQLISTKSYAFGFTEVTQIGYTVTNYEWKKVFQFYDKASGVPLEKVRVSSEGGSDVYNTSGVTDASGEYVIEKNKNKENNYRNSNVTFTAIYNKDTLRFRNRIYPFYGGDSNIGKRSKVEVFLDRGIYRPGQTLFFKGILLQKEGKKSTIVSQEEVRLYIESSNGDVLLEKEFITNEYGSFSGDFMIPKDVLTGQFRIYVKKGNNNTGFWKDISGHNNGYTYFKVEAYKRPTFEITFDTISKAYKPNDTITITGNAKAFLGSNITEADGTYTVTRKQVYRYWYYRANREIGRQLDNGTFKTDADGNFEVKYLANYEGISPATIFEFSVNVEITDLNGETRTALKTLKISDKNLLTTLTAPEEVKGGEAFSIEVENKNLNDTQVACDNTIKIFKLKTPNKILFDRLWETPEFQQISREDFQEAFPNELYDQDSIPKSKGALVYEGVFNDQSQYTKEILANDLWEAGTYIIEHTAISKKGTRLVTEKQFKLHQPKQQYLPKNQLFSYELLNENPQKDGFISLALKTSLKDLSVFVDGFHKKTRFYKDVIQLDGKETIKIKLDASFEKSVTIRLKYARFGRFFHEDIPVDISIPKDVLQIETQTFRSKLYPDAKEKWSFKIRNSKDEKVQAEILASMYDKSLDTYAKSYWNHNFGIRSYINNRIPSLENDHRGFVSVFRFRHKQGRKFVFNSRFDRINFYGLYLQRYEYLYNNYLREKRILQKQETKVTNSRLGNLKGVVLDKNGNRLSRAEITVKGTGMHTQTDAYGEFSIKAKSSDVLVISNVGYITQEYKVTGDVMYMTLEVDITANGIVITAQGIKREKKALGYAVSEVESEEVSVEVLNELSVVADDADYAFNADGNALTLTDTVAFNFNSDKALLYNSRSDADLDVFDFKGVKIRKNLNETAFFYPHLTTNRRGEVKFTFDAPQLLSQWRFRLLAHSKDIITGNLEKEVVTQKDVSLVPNAPRFLREGDTVELSAKIANLTSKEMYGAVQLQLFDALTMQPIDVALNNTKASQKMTITPYGNTNVFWRLDIPAGVQAVMYRMVAKAGSFSDGEENILPVLSNRMMITESVPFLVRAGEEREVTMNHLMQTTSKTLKHQKFALEYTSNPSWYALQALPYMMEFPHECSEQTFSRMYANSLSAKVLNSNPEIKKVFDSWRGDGELKSALEKNEELKSILIAETPWLRDMRSETEQKKRLGLLFDIQKNTIAQENTLAKLKEKQNDDGGFPWFSGGKSNPYITRHIVSGMGHLQKLEVGVNAPLMIEKAIDYLDIEEEDALARFIKHNKDTTLFYSRRDHLHFLYARSYFVKEYPLPVRVQEITNRSLQIYNDTWLSKSIYEKALLALVNYRLGNVAMSKKILTGLKESAVQSEINGMYWKDNRSGWYWYEAPIETQALLIEAFDEVLKDQETVEELKIWLLQQKRTSDWKTTKATAAATYALLMTGNSFTSLDDTTQIEMQTSELQKRMDEAPREQGTGYVKAVWNSDDVTTSLGKATIKNQGTTVGYGGMYWQYFEDLDKIEKTEGAVLNMSKALFLVDKSNPTKPLQEITNKTPLQLGQTIKVRLTVNVKSTMEFVHLKDMRASGLEPIDVISRHKYQDGLSYYQSTRDAATHFFFDNLPMGTYVLEYELRVNNKGVFSNGVSTIQSMYAPEFSGNTSGKKITVE
ncbi:alpha-2-macroglobulin family protein [uncultured Dokdonia sp.]|uniref:alpha-2-macroglobulin family protein n=1 Tax=uncultured Dokdonia sp. TaxID=575653 RepID=UPI00262AF2B9|nr:alpha-2-macroglobulin family protein [uncultured Dokdonia sp.]